MTAKPTGFIVTGGTGFIGRAVVTQLRARFGDRVPVKALGSDCNLEDGSVFGVFETLSQTFPCDHILHLAARAPSGEWLAGHPADGWYSNTLINANLFEAARRFFPGARVTTALSYSMYPPGEEARCETQVSLRIDDDNLAAYANVKTAVLVAQAAYARQYGMQCGGVVLPTVYGPDRRKSEFKQVVPNLCEKFINAAAVAADKVDLWGNGGQERDFLYVSDAADGIITAALGPQCDVINIGSGSYTSILTLAGMLADLVGFEGAIEFDEARYAGPQRRWMNVERAEKLLGWRPTTSLRNGLDLTMSDIRAQRARDVQESLV